MAAVAFPILLSRVFAPKVNGWVLARPTNRLALPDRHGDSRHLGLAECGIRACTPARRGRRNPAEHDVTLYRKRHRVENLFARLKDWLRIATRYDRCGELFLSAICIAATVIFWL